MESLISPRLIKCQVDSTHVPGSTSLGVCPCNVNLGGVQAVIWGHQMIILYSGLNIDWDDSWSAYPEVSRTIRNDSPNLPGVCSIVGYYR